MKPSTAAAAARVAVEAKALQPGRYGERTCQCQGVLVGMDRGIGWVQPLQAIDHPTAHWNRGKVYLAQRDLRRPDQALRPGDLMVFYLYADSKGLGAEDGFPMRDPTKNQVADEVPAKSWEPPAQSWQPWWAREGGGGNGYGYGGRWNSREPWWKREERDLAPARRQEYASGTSGAHQGTEATKKAFSSPSGADSTCSGLGDEDEASASRDDEEPWEEEELPHYAAAAAPASPPLPLFCERPPPGLELEAPPPPAGPPPGLQHPRGLKLEPSSQGQGPEKLKPTLSLVEMLA